LPEIRAILAALDSAMLDRGMVEALFGFSRSQAIRLMATLVAPEHGKPLLVGRDQLLAVLDQLLRTRPVQGEIARKRELREKLAALEREARPRSIPIAQPTTEAGHCWPAGITLAAPGMLTIAFGSPEELLGCVLALAEDAAGNYASFAARLAERPVQGPGQEPAQDPAQGREETAS
jgi:hypothetical protein